LEAALNSAQKSKDSLNRFLCSEQSLFYP